MGSKEVYSHYLLEVKRDYTKQLCNLLVPVMYEGILSLYTSAKNARKDLPMKMFQLVLSKVPEWNQHTISNEYNRIITKTNCEWINELITAVFISHAKILSSIKTRKKTKTLNLKIPNGDYFIHKAYIECARQFWKNPYLLFDEVNSVEYQRNLRDSEAIIEQCVEETIRKLLPIRNILQQYIAIDEESSSSSSDDDAPETVSNNKIKEHKTDTADQYNEEYVTHAISEKGKKRLEQSVKKTLKTSVKTEDDDKFSNYSVSQDVPLKKRKPIDNHNSGIVNIISAGSSNNQQPVEHVNNIEKINELYTSNLEGDMYSALDPSNSMEISFNQKNKKSVSRNNQSIDLGGSLTFDSIEKDIHQKPNSLHEDIVLQLNNPKNNAKQPISQFDKKSNIDMSENQISLHEDIVLNWDTQMQEHAQGHNQEHAQEHDKKSNIDIVLNWDNSKLEDKQELNIDINKKTLSLHDDIVLNLHDNKQDDKRSDKRSNIYDNVTDNQLSEKRSKSHNMVQLGSANEKHNLKSVDIKLELDTFNQSVNELNISNTSDIQKTKPTHKVGENVDIELVDYVKKINYDNESCYNLSLDFDITDPKTFITSNGSDVHKMPVSLVIDETDIKNSSEKNSSKTKNIIITSPNNGATEEPRKKTSLKRRSEKKNYSFF